MDFGLATELWQPEDRVCKGLIAVEGAHGAGKSTVVRALTSLFAGSGESCTDTREPSPTPLGDYVRAASEWLRGEALAALIAADRWHHVETAILPAVLRDMVVVTDRYFPSSLVLQSMDGVPLDYIVAVNRGIPPPALTVFLLCEAPLLVERRAQRAASTRFEREGDVEHEAALYTTLAATVMTRCAARAMTVDTSGTSPEEAARLIREQFQRRASQT